MTSSATPLSPDGLQAVRDGFGAVRAGLTFASREEPEAPVLVRRLRGSVASRFLALASFAAGAGLCAAFLLLRAVPSPAALLATTVVPVASRPLAPAWIEVVRPFTAYDLAGGSFSRLPLTYTARRDAGGTARQDTLTYGAASPGESFLRLMLYRRGDEPAPATTVFIDAARLAASAGLAITRSGLTSTLATRFGAFEVTGVAVARQHRSATCLAFRLADPATLAVLQVAGLACGTVEHPIDPASLACAIEKIDLVSAGDDEALRSVFVLAERRRGLGCSGEHSAALRPGLPDDGRAARGGLRGAL